MRTTIKKFNNDLEVEYSVNKLGELTIDYVVIDSLTGPNKINASALTDSRYAFFFSVCENEMTQHYIEYCADMKAERALEYYSRY